MRTVLPIYRALFLDTRLHRGAVAVSVTDDGGPHAVLAITVGELPTRFIWRTPPEEVIPILKAHPEVFAGDFSALADIAVTG